VTVSDSEVQKLTAEVAELKRLLSEERAQGEKVREKAFDQLYEELKQYKEDFVFQAEKPLLLDLLLFYDSLNWFQESLVKKEMSSDVIGESFQYLLDEFLEVLYRRDVHPFEAAETFDKQRHKAVKVVDSDDKEGDQRIAQVLKRGFVRSAKTLRPEEVVITRWRGARG
jgi:molecular chaperone GrpE (heat shock protein)